LLDRSGVRKQSATKRLRERRGKAFPIILAILGDGL